MMPTTTEFKTADRAHTSLLAAAEKRTLIWIAQRLPGWVNSDHLTGLGFVSLILAGASYWYARSNAWALLLVIPLLANLYLVCTLLCTVWMLGDFNTPEIVSGGAPQGQTTVLATLGVDYLMEKGKPALGVAVAISALPLLAPVAWLLVRRMARSEVQL